MTANTPTNPFLSYVLGKSNQVIYLFPLILTRMPNPRTEYSRMMIDFVNQTLQTLYSKALVSGVYVTETK